MGKVKPPVVNRSLWSWILTSNLKIQALLLLVILIAVFTRVLPLEMQKRIVNEAIRFGELGMLFRYCALYLAAVVLAVGLKYLINVLQNIIGEAVLADMRKELYHHILTLPLNFFRKTQPGLVVSSLVAELATAGNFVGMAIAVPVTSVLTLLAFAGYLLWLNPLLAIISLSIYPLVLLLVPMVQRRANLANKERVDVTRTLSVKIGEAITGIHEIHGNGSYRIENRKYDKMVEALRKVRVAWNLYKFGVKVLNNLLNNLSLLLPK